MDVFFILLFILIVVSLRPQKEAEAALLPENTKPLRGVMAIAIILHHMSEKTVGGVLFPLLQHMGYLIVAVFFFLSGYGLLVAYKKKGTSYLKGFWKKRILYIFIVFVWISMVYAVYHIIVGNFKFSLTIAANSWYMVIQILLYVFFWLAFKLTGSRSRLLSIGCVFIFQTALVFVLKANGYEGIWYMSNYAFIAGLLWANYNESINQLINKKYWLCAGTITVGFALFSAIPLMLESTYLPCRMISTVFFCGMVVLILCKVKITGIVWNWLGDISLEIYLLHGLVYMSLKWFITSEILWTALTVALTIPIAYGAKLLNVKLRGVLYE